VSEVGGVVLPMEYAARIFLIDAHALAETTGI
jgi:hypothetical protein